MRLLDCCTSSVKLAKNEGVTSGPTAPANLPPVGVFECWETAILRQTGRSQAQARAPRWNLTLGEYFKLIKRLLLEFLHKQRSDQRLTSVAIVLDQR